MAQGGAQQSQEGPMTEPDMRHGQMECFAFGHVGDASGMPKLARRGFIMPSMGGPRGQMPEMALA